MASSSTKVIVAALIGNMLIAITKFAAAIFTNSSAMLSEGIHSLVDTGNQGMLLYGLKQSKRPPSEQYPFGHGKEIYFYSFLVAIFIFAIGAGVSIYEGVQHTLHPEPVNNPLVNYFVLGAAFIFEGGAWYFALKEFRRIKGDEGYIEAVHNGKDPTIFVVLFEDSAAMLGLVIAFFGILMGQVTGNPIYDGLASIVIGLILAGTALWLAIETKSLLIGESASPKTVHSIRKLISNYETVQSVNEILTMHMGPEFVLVNVSVDFADEITADEIERTIDMMDHEIKALNPLVKRVFVEAESRKRAN